MRQTGGLSAEATSWPGLRGNIGGNSFPSVVSGQVLAPQTGLGALGRAGFGRHLLREGREEQLCGVSVSSCPSVDVKTRERVCGKSTEEHLQEALASLCLHSPAWRGGNILCY